MPRTPSGFGDGPHRCRLSWAGIDLCHGRHDDSRTGATRRPRARPALRPATAVARRAARAARPAVGTSPRRSANGGTIRRRSTTAIPARPVAAPDPPARAAPTPMPPDAGRPGRGDPRGADAADLPGASARRSRSRRRASAASPAPTSRRSPGPAASCTSRTSTSGRGRGRSVLADALPRTPTCRSSSSSRATPTATAPHRRGEPDRPRAGASSRCAAAGGDRVAVYDLENRADTPIYVHAKVCIVDDVWLDVGSDNLNRRSWTHDSEIGLRGDRQRRSTAVAARSRRPRRRRPSPRPQHAPRALARTSGPQRRRRRRPGRPARQASRRCAKAPASSMSGRGGRTRRPAPGPPSTARHRAVPRYLNALWRLSYQTTLDPDGRARPERTAETY